MSDGDGEMERRRDRKMERWRDGETERGDRRWSLSNIKKQMECVQTCLSVCVCVCMCGSAVGYRGVLQMGRGHGLTFTWWGGVGGGFILGLLHPPPPLPWAELGTHGCHLLRGAEGITEAQQHVLFSHTLHMIYIIQKISFSTPQACGWVNNRCLLSKSRC